MVIRNSNARVFEGKWSPAEALHGFIDFHTQAWGDALRDVLIFGVTTKLEAEGKDLNIADLPSAGYFATVPGGQGTEYGMPVPTLTFYSWFG